MAGVLKENKVLVTLYSERQAPRSSKDRDYERDGANKAVTNQWKHGTDSKGYSRRAEILNYSRRLRGSVPSPASSQIKNTPDIVSSKNKHPIAKNGVINLIVNVCGKPKGTRFPTCFSNLILRSYRAFTSSQSKELKKQKQSSESTSNNIKDNMKRRRRRLLKFTCI